jgi:multidrug efflux pump subunit AcrA (membrane-fusion protein)
MKKKMKKIKIAGIILALLSIIGTTLALTVGGATQNEALAQETKTVTVGRGNLSIEISAAGNLALSQTEDLAFQVAGTVVEVLVQEGDSVKEGQELAKLDTTEWDKQLKTLEKELVTAQRNLTAKESDITKAERQVAALERQVISKESDVTKVERQVTEKEFAVREAELAVQTAENSLSQIEDVKKAQDALDDAEQYLNIVKSILSGILGGGLEFADNDYWSLQKSLAIEELAEAQQDLQDILDGNNVKVSDDVALQLAESQLQIEKSKMALEDAQISVDDAKSAVADAHLVVEDAQYAVEEAKSDVDNAKYAVDDAKSTLEDTQSALDEAKSLSPIITAPFDGFIPQISVKGGDEVLKGTVAMQLADPDKFEAEISVSEMDISQIELGGQARVQIDAADGVTLLAVVTYIAPTATIQSGVVNYKVTVEVQSTVTTSSQTPVAGDNATMTSPTETQGAPGQATTMLPEDFQLREGLTVTVSLIVAQRQDVLLVPYAAITTERGQKYVQVVTSTGETEKRAITTGITDYQYTEVTDGLTEGEQVLVSQGTTTKSTTTTQEQSQSGIMIPGMSGGPSGPPPGGQ